MALSAFAVSSNCTAPDLIWFISFIYKPLNFGGLPCAIFIDVNCNLPVKNYNLPSVRLQNGRNVVKFSPSEQKDENSLSENRRG